MKTTTYVVYRYGSNAANQSMTQEMPIGVYSGTGKTAIERRVDACRQAEEEHTVYANQRLDAMPHNRVSVEDYEAAREYQDVVAMLRAEALASIR